MEEYNDTVDIMKIQSLYTIAIIMHVMMMWGQQRDIHVL